MLRIAPGGDSAPTMRLTAAFNAVAPDLFTAPAPNHATLTIQPRSNVPGPREMTRDAWYDLVWTHPAVDVDDGLDGPELSIEHTEIVVLGHLPAPPRIPAETRIAAAPPVSLDNLDEGMIAMYGGPDETRKLLTDQRDAAIRSDRSADAYDWIAYARKVAAEFRTLALHPPKLTPGQRAQVAAARLLEAHWAVAAARESVRALLDNAVLAGDTDDVDKVRAVLPLIDQPITADA